MALAAVALGMLSGFGTAQLVERPERVDTRTPRSTPTSTVYSATPDERTVGFALSTGDTVGELLQALDAVTDAQIARVAGTDGPQQGMAIHYLHRQHDRMRTVIITYFYGWLPAA